MSLILCQKMPKALINKNQAVVAGRKSENWPLVTYNLRDHLWAFVGYS